MRYETTYRLEDFILGLSWEGLPGVVRERIKGCLLDLLGALITGSRSSQFEAGRRLAAKLYGYGSIPVPGCKERFGFMGASTAMGHSSNAYDIDDGHNLLRAHPGTAVVGPVLAAAYEKNVSRNEFLLALLAAYETTIRSGLAIMEHYSNPHSSGTFGPAGIAAGVGRIYGFSRQALNNCISIAEFHAPLVDGSRSVSYPSMNKDGVAFGAMTGALAIEEHLAGFRGNKNLLESDRYSHYLDDLGKHYMVMDLYFKPYTCCRWAHPAIDACLSLLDREVSMAGKESNEDGEAGRRGDCPQSKRGLRPEDIEKVVIETFLQATRLSRVIPKNTDEAQYNIAYPVAAALVYGDFGIAQCHESRIPDKRVVNMMRRLEFREDPELSAQFPARRVCRAVITAKDGSIYRSDDWEPRGEAAEQIGFEWLQSKFHRITAPVFSEKGREKVISMVRAEEDYPVRELLEEINREEYWTGI